MGQLWKKKVWILIFTKITKDLALKRKKKKLKVSKLWEKTNKKHFIIQNFQTFRMFPIKKRTYNRTINQRKRILNLYIQGNEGGELLKIVHELQS